MPAPVPSASAPSRSFRHLVFGGLLVAFVPATLRAAGSLESHPLAAPSAPRGETLFTTLDPAVTGVVTENHYADPRMWGDRYQEFALGSIGTGVAISDYDGDGRPDIFIVSKTERARLFRNLGGWRFEDVTARAGLEVGDPGVWKQGATFSDVNNDGRPDIYLCRYAAPNQLFINRGDGTFGEEAAARGLDLVDACGMGAFCDYDRDGWIDIYVQTNMLDAARHPNGQRDYLLRNRGDGYFENVTVPAGISGETLAHAAIWWDFNEDGWPDIYVANDFGPPDALYRNNGDGTFTNVVDTVIQHTPYSAMGADLGDVNNDGLVDFLVADMATTTHEKDHRGMAAARSLSREADNRADVAPQYLRNALYLNTGVAVMQEAAILAGVHATDWTWSPRLEDLDNDGWLDLFLTNGMNREYQNVDLRERIILAENLEERMRLMRESPVLNENNLAYRRVGGPAGEIRFEEVGRAWGLDQFGVSFGAAFGDLDGDGDLDVVVTHYKTGATLLRNDSETGRRVIFSLRGTRSNRAGVGATVRLRSASGTQVRTLVLARGYLSTSEPILHFGLGSDERIDEAVVSWPSGHTQTFSGLAAGRRYVVVEPDSDAVPGKVGLRPAHGTFADVSQERGLGLPTGEVLRPESSRQPLIPTTFHRRGPGLAVGDIDADGRDDLVLGGTTMHRLRVIHGVGDTDAATSYRQQEIPTEPSVPDGPFLLFDADADDDLDLLLTKTGVGVLATSPRLAPRLLLNDGVGGFTPAAEGVLPATPISAGAVAAADFDRDGRLDVFIGARVLPGSYPVAPRSLLLANRPEGFVDVSSTLAPKLSEVGMVTSALWSDADGDGWLDLIVATEWGHVRLFRSREGAGFEDRSEESGFAAAGVGWWTSLATADLNGDGRPDYVVGNQGLNSQYSASPERPAVLYLGAFGGVGAKQIIEGYYECDRLLPRHTLKALGAAIPAVRRKYRKNDDYARASLEEIVGAEALAAAQRFAATELRSGVFLSRSEGTWRFEPLPHLAQISVAQGMVAGDFDGDGCPDVVLTHNSHSPTHEIGRFDGGIGLMLRGDPDGSTIGLRVVPPRESGVIVPGDAKALVVLDLEGDGAPDLIASRNNSTTLAFSGGTAPGRGFLRVDLRGPRGNPTAVGARVVMTTAQGSKRAVEVLAGSGHFSQSSPACFFGYRPDDPPSVLDVYWPNGVASRHEVPAGTKILKLRSP